MLNLLFKSAFYYTIIKRYGNKLLFIFLNILFIFFIQFIYIDITDYVKSVYLEEELKSYLLYALLAKMGLFLLSIGLISYTIYKIFNSKVEDKGVEGQLKKKKQLEDTLVESTLPIKETHTKDSETSNSSKSIEQQIREKQTLKSKADSIIEDLKS